MKPTSKLEGECKESYEMEKVRDELLLSVSADANHTLVDWSRMRRVMQHAHKRRRVSRLEHPTSCITNHSTLSRLQRRHRQVRTLSSKKSGERSRARANSGKRFFPRPTAA